MAALVLLAGICAADAHAQSRTETRNYERTLGKPSLEAYDRFLKKYPSSVYADDVRARRDTLLNISPYDMEEARTIISAFTSTEGPFIAFADRREAKDRIYGFRLLGQAVEISAIEKAGDEWKKIFSYENPSQLSSLPTEKAFVDGIGEFRCRGARHIQFSYLVNYKEEAQRQAYVAACFCPQTEEYRELAFSGKSLLQDAGSSTDYRIEGRVRENMTVGMDKPEMRALLGIVESNDRLVKIPDNYYLADVDIEWWNDNNPDALTTAKSLKMNIIQEGSALIEQFGKAKRQSSGKYSAALLDIRGYTVIVAYRKAQNDYILAWAEPECKDRYRDRLLNSISFDNADTLSLFFYQRNKTFKYRINLSSKTLSRR